MKFMHVSLNVHCSATHTHTMQWRETWDKHLQWQHKKHQQEIMNVPHIPK
jgi:hypothetical protein